MRLDILVLYPRLFNTCPSKYHLLTPAYCNIQCDSKVLSNGKTLLLVEIARNRKRGRCCKQTAYSVK